MLLSLAGRTALVTGGGRGIGREISLLFGRLGARVVVAYGHDKGAAQRTASDVREAGAQADALGADLSRAGEGERLVKEAVAFAGGIDVLVVNHGIWKRAPIEEMTAEQWDETLQVNLTSARELCAEAARHMLPRGTGAIVLVASTSGQRGEAHYSHYSASKGALLALTRSLAAELGPRGIRVNAVAPGWVMTEMSRAALESDAGKAATAAIPLGRPGRPEEIAGPVAFLASDLSSYMHGNVLSVNGGAVMIG